ncbi:ABC transporter permease [Halorussus sp. MSC15.2]|uniref:ABC transporter permease n=1 Tax=Halorussus sp. MSC15.2 TaxID=2283638 RepID=UPI0013D4B9C3|nr:hypothetical protein [Halorussus sp. MSC15.2]NEU59002.1 hypothetical protein [Halorussus sp. MSC15.2]
MSQLRACYHVARTSFYSRLAGYRLLVVVVVGAYFALSKTATVGFARDLAVDNAALVGSHTAVVAAITILLLGFFVVRDAIAMDRYNGPGELIAATPIRNLTYVFGKWLGNVSVLTVASFMMAVIAIVRFQLQGVGPFNLWKLLSPFVLLTIPAVMLVSALALLFETVERLRGGWASVAYFLMVILILVSGVVDPMGIRPVVSSIQSVPESQTLDGQKVWHGLSLTGEVALRRLLYAAAALGIVVVSAVRFDRFDGSDHSGTDANADSDMSGDATSPDRTPVGTSLSPVETNVGSTPCRFFAPKDGLRSGASVGGGTLAVGSSGSRPFSFRFRLSAMQLCHYSGFGRSSSGRRWVFESVAIGRPH